MAMAEAATRVLGLTYVGTGIPLSHRDLVECPPVAAMTTVMPDGTPHTSAVWCDLDPEGEQRARFAETEIPALCRIRPTRVAAMDASSDRGAA
jgi:hypothetical protein